MKSAIFLACLALAVAVPLYGQQKDIRVGEDGTIVVSVPGKRIIFSRPQQYEKYVEVVVSPSYGPTRTIQINNENQVVRDYLQPYQKSTYEHALESGNVMTTEPFGVLGQMYQIFKPYQGVIDEKTWMHIMTQVGVAVQRGEIPEVVFDTLTNIDSHNYGQHGTSWQKFYNIHQQIRYTEEMEQLAKQTVRQLQRFYQGRGWFFSSWMGQQFEHQMQEAQELVQVLRRVLQLMYQQQQQYGYQQGYGQSFSPYGYFFNRFQGPYSTGYSKYMSFPGNFKQNPMWWFGHAKQSFGSQYFGNDMQKIASNMERIRWQLHKQQVQSYQMMQEHERINNELQQIIEQEQVTGQQPVYLQQEKEALVSQQAQLVHQQLVHQREMEQLYQELFNEGLQLQQAFGQGGHGYGQPWHGYGQWWNTYGRPGYGFGKTTFRPYGVMAY